MQPLTQIEAQKLSEALQELGITPQAIQQLRMAPFPVAQQLLKQLKEAAHKAYRRLVFELHPDRNAGDPIKAEKLAFLSRVAKEVEGLQVQPPPPPMVIQHITFVRVHQPINGAAPAGTTPGSVYTAFRVANMRPT